MSKLETITRETALPDESQIEAEMARTRRILEMKEEPGENLT